MKRTDSTAGEGDLSGQATRKEKRETQSVRLRSSVRESIAQQALSSGRSISEEIEYRLERSFDEPRYALGFVEYFLEERYGSKQNQSVLANFAIYMNAATKHLGRPWHETPTGVRLAMGMVRRAAYLQILMETETVAPGDPSQEEMDKLVVDVFRRASGLDAAE